MNKKEALEKIESLKAALPAASEEIDEIVKVLTKPIWHDGRVEEPNIDGTDCIFMSGVDENDNPQWEVAKWNDKEKAFPLWVDEYKQNCWFPAENFAPWAYISDLIDMDKLKKWLASPREENQKYMFRKSK